MKNTILSSLNIYDTDMLPKVNREDFLRKNHLYFLDLTLEPYRKYIEFTEDYLDNKADDFQQKHLESLENENGSWKVSEEYANKMMQIDNEFAQRYRESIIVQLFSLLEGALVSSCEMYYSNKELDKTNTDDVPDKAGFDYDKNFLKNNAKIELIKINKELDFFTKLRTLRNRIVHHKTSFFTDDKKKINQLKALSKNRFKLHTKEDIFPMYFLHFDNPDFSFEIIEKIKSLYVKLGENRVYY